MHGVRWVQVTLVTSTRLVQAPDCLHQFNWIRFLAPSCLHQIFCTRYVFHQITCNRILSPGLLHQDSSTWARIIEPTRWIQRLVCIKVTCIHVLATPPLFLRLYGRQGYRRSNWMWWKIKFSCQLLLTWWMLGCTQLWRGQETDQKKVFWFRCYNATLLSQHDGESENEYFLSE